MCNAFLLITISIAPKKADKKAHQNHIILYNTPMSIAELGIDRGRVEEYELKKKYPLVIVLGTAIRPHPVTDEPYPPDIAEDEKGKMVGGLLRAKAAGILYGNCQTDLFGVTGGVSKYGWRDHTLRDYMVRHGVPYRSIETIGGERENGNTKGNIANAARFLHQLEEDSNRLSQLGSLNQIAILGNVWQKKRGLLFLRDNPFFAARPDVKVDWLSAESIVLKNSPELAPWVEYFLSHPFMKERLALEDEGVRAYLANEYKQGNGI